MTTTDLLVVGAGPGGLAAAIEGARAGLRVLVIDDNLRAGGQIYRQLPSQFAPSPRLRQRSDFRKGRALLDEAAAAGVEFRLGSTAWGSFEPNVMELMTPGGPEQITSSRTIIATGAHDRPVPIPGWTLPGVFTVGGAQALLKSQRVRPGRRMLLAGVGPLLLVVASQLSEAGVEVVAVSEPVSPWASLSILPALAREWSLLLDGFCYKAGLRRRGVPWLSRTVLTRIEGDTKVEAAVTMRADDAWRPVAGTERRFEVDAVAIGYGLLPSLELPRICGCAVEYDPPRRAWRPVRTPFFESSVAGIFIVGDGAGVAGAMVAVEEGRVAGLMAAHQLSRSGREEAARLSAGPLKRLRRLERFRHAVDRAFALQDGIFEVTDPATVACRCEEVSFADVAAAVDDGADSPAMLKSFTRCGMGPCQGRMCAASTAEWLASRTRQSVEALGLAPAAPPAKPVVPLAALAALAAD